MPATTNDLLAVIGRQQDETEFYTPMPSGYVKGKHKYVIVVGTVMSGLGKGIFSSSLAKLMKDKGLKVAPIKMEGYLNIDSGTLNPYRHGEVFVLDDGMETDMDLGTYERMLEKGPERFQVKPAGLPAMDHLYDELPNFHPALDDVKRQLALCHDSRDALEITPMLLLGPPGVGKTHFAREVAQLLGTGLGFVSMSSLTAGWVLSGASSQWKGARPGKGLVSRNHGDLAGTDFIASTLGKCEPGSLGRRPRSRRPGRAWPGRR